MEGGPLARRLQTFHPRPTRAAAALRAALLALALALPAASLAAPVAPSGADPVGPAPARGVDLYVAPGAPAAAVGGDLGLSGFALGGELAWLWPGALRPELHARRPFEVGRALFSPRLSAGYSIAATSFGGAPSASTLEVGAGFTAGVPLGQFTPFADLGVLGLSDLRYRTHTRLFGTGAAGARFQAAPRLGLGGWVGTLASVGRFAPAGGVWAAMRFGAEELHEEKWR